MRAGSDPGLIAITLRAGVFDMCQSYDHAAETGCPAAPTASWSTGLPKSRSAADDVIAPAPSEPGAGETIADCSELRPLNAPASAAGGMESVATIRIATAPAACPRASRAAPPTAPPR